MKRVLSVILICTLLLVCAEPLLLKAKAADVQAIDSGKAGANVTWTLYDDGTLEFSGYGAMDDNKDYVVKKWSSNYCDQIERIVFKSGITYIGEWTFNSPGKYSKLKSVSIPSTVTKIGKYAFNFPNTMEEVHITDLTKWCKIEFANDYANPLRGNDLYVNGELVENLVIPSSITSISDYAFKECRSIRTVDFSYYTNSIGAYAFNACANLGKLIFRGNAPTMGDHMLTLTAVYAYYPGNNSSWTSDVMLDYGGNTTWVAYDPAKDDVTSDDFPGKYVDWEYNEETATLRVFGYGEIDNYSTYYLPPWNEHKEDAVNLVVEEGITAVGKNAFFRFTALTNLTLPSTLESIDTNGFCNCTALKNVSIPAVKTIGEAAFYQCQSLEEIVLPDGLETLGYLAFRNCTSLKQASVPDSVTEIGESALSGCPQLQGIWVGEGNPNYSSDSFGVLFNKDKTTLIQVPGGMTGYYAIPDTVTSIGRNAMNGSLTEVVVPGSVAVIESDTFSWPVLEKVTFQDGVKSMSHGVFSNSEALKEIHFLGDSPEFSTKTMSNIKVTAYYPGDNETWTEDKLQNYGGIITWVPYTPVVEEIASGTCGENLTWTLTADGTLTISGEGPMDDYDAGYPSYILPPWSPMDTIVKVVIEEGVTTIGDYAFAGCCNLPAISIPDSITTIGDYAFNYCGSLTDVTIPDSVTTIGEWAFCDCSSLTGITIPDGVTTVGKYAFNNCDGLTGITIPESVTTIAEGTFSRCDNLTDVTIPDSVTAIGGYAFSSCTSLTSMTIPDSVTSIGETAFGDCTSLVSVTIPDSVTTIGDFAFMHCSSLESVTIPDSVTSMGNNMFVECSSLVSATIPGSVTSTGEYTFYGCSNLRDVTIGDGVTTIGNYAFNRCSSLTSVTIPGSVITLGKGAFFWCTDLTSVTFEGDAPAIGEWAFSDVAATAYYPAGNETWTDAVMQDYDGTLTWVAYTRGCPGHEYEAIVTEPTCEVGGYTTYTCKHCGDSYVSDQTDPVNHSYKDGHCIWCGEKQLVRWYSGTTSLKGTIDLNMYVILDEEVVNDPEVFVRFSFEYRQVDVPMADALESTFDNGVVAYRFSCPLYAKQVADEVVVQVMRGDTPVGEPKAYSAMQYCKNLIRKNQDPKQVAMCKAMLNYATAAQLLFNYHTDNLANASLSDADKNLPDVDASAFKYTVSNNQQPGIKAKSATMMMESEIRIRVYFELKNGHSIDEYTFTIDGVEVQPQQNADGWFIESEGILAKEMEDMHDFCFGGITVHYGALSYVNSKLKSDDPLEVNLAKALYAYYIAAEALLG